MRLHRHAWELAAEQFNEPYEGRMKITYASSEMFALAAYGFTVVTYRCLLCPRRRFDRVIGRTADASSRILK